MIGRVAHFRYKGDPDYANVDLASKIEFVLDEVLGTMNIKRLDPIVIVLDESESDEDYWLYINYLLLYIYLNYILF